ncbi:MAG TPA: ferrous iron transporter B [Candidatus Ornithomonoglobus intestinigallinarum]|uniref:Fe(2+) transporter FeoB n=1 Tax=Candidatus Ornithomonoglobus intestinigallinarum TaxID=2840894 RepID=A0A9D1KNY9_9FIRM|nr:ferrous iron transporter B [Candidatus Ornithomonoglobus intestinigallinarum]
MSIRIALAGNPNSGKTTLFNALTGSNQFVGNWPGVTVEKKEGKLKKHGDVTITDLPGIYSLSPYTLEEVVARNYLIEERPDAILNIVDGTNLERNLYLTTQLTELGIPVVVAINMMDIVRKNGDKINISELSKRLGCTVVEISALKGTGISDAAEAAIKAANGAKTVPMHTFTGVVEHAIAHIEEAVLHDLPEERQRWYAIKIFERDEKVIERLNIPESTMVHIEKDIAAAEKELDDDAESIITNDRYVYIGELMKSCCKKRSAGKLTTSDKIDKVVTNRFLALPIFAAVMFIVYYVSVTTVGTWVTDWTNDGLFGDGWHLFGIGSGQYEEAISEYAAENLWTDELVNTVTAASEAGVTGADDMLAAVEDGDFGGFDEAYGTYGDALAERGFDISEMVDAGMENAPDTSEFGVWVPGIPVIVESGLDAINCAEWLRGLIVDGIVGGVGAVLGFVPQMLVLFIFLAFLEACGYMARIAFVMDRIFRKFGLSGKSFIPMLIGTGCGVPGVMASRTIENDRDRKMTIMTTTFIPCGAKVPIIALIASALFGGAWWVAPSAYFIGVAAIIVSGIMLKKTKMFAGDPAPFVMELPAYHMPTVSNVLRSMWERGSSFIKRAGTVILLSSIIIWAGSCFGMINGSFGFSPDMELENSVLGIIGGAISWIFAPLGFGNIKATVATIMGLVAKEEVVAVFGVLDFEGMTQLSAYSFMIFNLLCAPCFAAIGAIKREMNNAKWTWFAIGYQCVFAYAVSLVVYQFGSLFTGSGNAAGVIVAAAIVVFLLYMLFRPYKEATRFTGSVKIKKAA